MKQKNSKKFWLLSTLPLIAISAPIFLTSCNNTSNTIGISPKLAVSKYNQGFITNDRIPGLSSLTALENTQKAKEFIQDSENIENIDIFSAMFELHYWNIWKECSLNPNILDFRNYTTFRKMELLGEQQNNDLKIEAEFTHKVSYTEKDSGNTVYIEKTMKSTNTTLLNSFNNSKVNENITISLSAEINRYKVNNVDQPTNTKNLTISQILNKQFDVNFIGVIEKFLELKDK